MADAEERKSYESPVLKKIGNVKDITLGQAGNYPDGMGGSVYD